MSYLEAEAQILALDLPDKIIIAMLIVCYRFKGEFKEQDC